MASPACVGLLFFGLAAIFLAAALRDYLRAEGERSWPGGPGVRIAIVSAVVGIGLQLVPVFLGP